ncbi:hypothetical protein Hanom_Chr17g01564901 [Helianthus anomalus]
MIINWNNRQEDDDYQLDVYRVYEELFSLKVHHGGWFTQFPDRIYKNDQICYVDLLNTEKFCVADVHAIAKELDYEGFNLHYHYLPPGEDLDFGIKPLSNHHNVLSLLRHLPNNR